ncbi:20706_t:CDS:1, partial [Dentiscutata erythropus]
LVPKYEALRKEKEEFNDTAETEFEKYLDSFLNYLEILIPPTSNNFKNNVKNKTEKLKDKYQKLIDENKKIKESENNFYQ